MIPPAHARHLPHPRALLRRQRAIGNQSTQRLQTKLKIGAPGDKHEQEADRVSDQVLRMPEAKAASPCSCGGECAARQTKQAGHAHRRTEQSETSDATRTVVPPLVHQVLGAPGHPLDSGIRAFFEPRLGCRWRWLDLSVNAGRTYDPTRAAGMDRLFTVGATLQIGPSVPR